MASSWTENLLHGVWSVRNSGCGSASPVPPPLLASPTFASPPLSPHHLYLRLASPPHTRLLANWCWLLSC